MAVKSEDTPAGALAKAKTQPAQPSKADQGDGPPDPEVTPAAERQAEADTEDDANADVEDMAPEDLRAEVLRLRQALVDAGQGAAARTYKPSFIMSEGVRLDLWETGKAVDPMTGDLFERDPESHTITRTKRAREPERERPAGETEDVTDQVPTPRSER